MCSTFHLTLVLFTQLELLQSCTLFVTSNRAHIPPQLKRNVFWSKKAELYLFLFGFFVSVFFIMNLVVDPQGHHEELSVALCSQLWTGINKSQYWLNVTWTVAFHTTRIWKLIFADVCLVPREHEISHVSISWSFSHWYCLEATWPILLSTLASAEPRKVPESSTHFQKKNYTHVLRTLSPFVKNFILWLN